jgi:hypothetical protein
MASDSKSSEDYILSDIPSNALTEFKYIAAFIFDTYYNGLYVKAQEYFNAKKRDTLTQCYKVAIANYWNAFKDSNNCMKILQSFYAFYSRTSGSNCSQNECLYELVQVCITEELFQYMSSQQKTKLLMNIWLETIESVTRIVHAQFIDLIINNRNDSIAEEATKHQLVKEIILILARIRSGIITDIFNRTHSINPGSNRKDDITPVAAQRMKESISRLTQERNELLLKLDKLEKIILRIHNENKELKETVESLEQENSEQKVAINTMAINIRGYRRALGENESAPLYNVTSTSTPAPISNDVQPKHKTTPTVGGSRKSNRLSEYTPEKFNREMNQRITSAAKNNHHDDTEADNHEADNEEVISVVSNNTDINEDGTLDDDIKTLEAARAKTNNAVTKDIEFPKIDKEKRPKTISDISSNAAELPDIDFYT